MHAVAENYEQTHTHTHGTATVMITRLFEALKLNRYNTTYTHAKPLIMKHMC